VERGGETRDGERRCFRHPWAREAETEWRGLGGALYRVARPCQRTYACWNWAVPGYGTIWDCTIGAGPGSRLSSRWVLNVKNAVTPWSRKEISQNTMRPVIRPRITPGEISTNPTSSSDFGGPEPCSPSWWSSLSGILARKDAITAKIMNDTSDATARPIATARAVMLRERKQQRQHEHK